MESISIKNFGGIDNLEISLNKINVFIGAQASGKSVTAKLIYFFKGLVWDFYQGAIDGKSKIEVDKKLISKFEDYFPADTWSSKNFAIVYRFNAHYIVVRKDKTKPKISYSDAINQLHNRCKEIINEVRKKSKSREKFGVFRYDYVIYEKYIHVVTQELDSAAGFRPLFVPAGRSFFAHLQNSIFSFLSSNKAIDPFLVEFGSYYEQIKLMESSLPLGANSTEVNSMADNFIEDIIGGKYQREENKDYLIHRDKRKIKVSFSSSGQQETLPLLLILKSLLSIGFSENGPSLFIEEPEAHLFPAAQKKVIELMGLAFNNAVSDIQLLITTHSPYVLTSINNLVQASIIHKSATQKGKKKVEKIIAKEIMIEGALLNAYAFKDGGAESIIDPETGLIYATYLDKVSEEIAIQFDSLLNL